MATSMIVFTSSLITFLLGGQSSSIAAFAPFPQIAIRKYHNHNILHSAPFGCVAHQSQRISLQMIRKGDADNDDDDEDDEEDDDEEDPLSNGIDSVTWLPSVAKQSTKTISAVRNGAQIYPLFPLGGIVYTPCSDHILNIFEPRYRELYNDILMNGSKRFIVSMSHPTEEGTFAETGVVFQLLDLKEVSGMTGDQIKYICNHRVVGRVQLHRILNPEAWKSRETYLRVEATPIQETQDTRVEGLTQLEKDSDTTSDIYRNLRKVSKTTEEQELIQSFEYLVKLQHDLEEDVRFTRSSIASLAVSPGDGDNSLWQSVRLWQNFIEQRLVMAQNEMQTDFQTKLLEFLKKEKGFTDKDIPNAIGFNDLSPSLQKEVQELQKRMQAELQPLVLESILTIQKILEATDHKDRIHLLRYFVDAERKRLEAKNSLKGMFKRVLSSSEPSSISGSMEGRTERFNEPPQKEINEVVKTSLFIDEDGAFQ